MRKDAVQKERDPLGRQKPSNDRLKNTSDNNGTSNMIDVDDDDDDLSVTALYKAEQRAKEVLSIVVFQ